MYFNFSIKFFFLCDLESRRNLLRIFRQFKCVCVRVPGEIFHEFQKFALSLFSQGGGLRKYSIGSLVSFHIAAKQHFIKYLIIKYIIMYSRDTTKS